MGGLITIRLDGPGNVLAWGLIALGLLTLLPFVRFENRPGGADRRRPPAERRGRWPCRAAFLFGMSVLGAQIRCRRSRAPTRTSPATVSAPPPGSCRRSARRLRDLPGDQRVHLPLTSRLLEPARCADRLDLLVATPARCGCPSTTTPGRRCSTWPSPASAPTRSWPPCRRWRHRARRSAADRADGRRSGRLIGAGEGG